jgi:Transglutaminase-like superfamily
MMKPRQGTARPRALHSGPLAVKELPMARQVVGFFALLLTAGAGLAAEPMGKLVREDWDAAYLDGQKAGHVRTTVREIERDGQKVLRTTMTLELTLRRFQDTVKMGVETGTEETPEGKVVGVFMKQSLGKEQTLHLVGTVEGEQLHVKVSGSANMDKKIKWNDQVIGLYKEQQLFQDKKAKPGDTFSYLHFEPLINAVVTIQVTVKDYEDVKIYGGTRKLLRAEAIPEKIQGVQLPATSFWLSKEWAAIRSEVAMPGLGNLVLVRTTKEAALAPVEPAKMSDIGITQLIPLNRRIADPANTKKVVYRITLPNDDTPATAFAQDNRQQVKNSNGKTFELHVSAVRRPPEKSPDKVFDEIWQRIPWYSVSDYATSSFFINCDDAKVRELAQKAVGDEADPWKKVQRIEKWVRNNMNNNQSQDFTEAMATADHVARTLTGDCTEHAMLAAAMCRAVGVPSKIAVGLVYVDHGQKGPVLGYHMWTEVWLRGEWVPIDATLGRGSIGAAHLKISDHSWHDIQSLKPLLPVMRVMLGKVSVEVIRVEGE